MADRAFDAFNTFSEAIQAVAKPQASQDVSDEDTEDIEAEIEAELNAATTDGYSQELYSSDEAHQAAMSIAPGSALPFGAQQPIMQTFDTNSFVQTPVQPLSKTSQDATSQDATSQDATSQDATSQDATSQDATSQDATSQVNQASSQPSAQVGQADCFTGGPVVVVPSQSTRKLVKQPTPEQERHANILREVTMCRESDLSIS